MYAHQCRHADTIIDFDRILVLRAGRVVEFDSPVALLDKPDGAFRDMVEVTGRFDELYERAKKGGPASKRNPAERPKKSNGRSSRS